MLMLCFYYLMISMVKMKRDFMQRFLCTRDAGLS